MDRLLPPSTESTRERRLVGAGTALLHILLIYLLLHGAAGESSGTAGTSQVNGDGLVVEFIAIPRAASQPQALPVLPSVLSASSANAAIQERFVSEIVEAAEHKKVLGESGDYSSIKPFLDSRPGDLSASAATSANPSGKEGNPSDDLLGSYRAALRAAIQRQWTVQTDSPFPSGCVIRLIQSAGGALNASSATSCDLPREERLQLEAAALMAQPLPYVGYEAVFAEDMLLQL